MAMVLILFFLIVLLNAPLVTNSETVEKLRVDSIYSTNDTLQSSNGVFQLGLVSLGGALYLAIWYSKPLTNVWVANRNNPIRGATASFGLDARDLALTLNNDAGRVVWSAGRNASVAILLDTGNLVIQSPNQSLVWESFDYPGNTWLPYMKIGVHANLTSWVSPDDPSDGPFSMIMLQDTREYLLLWRNNSTIKYYGTSGAWVDGKGFPDIPEMYQTASYNYSFTDDGFSWNPYDGNATFLSRIILDTDGIIKHQRWDNPDFGWSILWVAPKQCQVYSFCGAFGICQANSSTLCTCPPGFSPTNSHHWASQVWYEGCKPNTPLDCDRDREFTPIDHQTSFDIEYLTTQYSTLDYSSCMDACKKNCDCTGFYFHERAKNCSLFSGELLNGEVSLVTYDSGVFYLRVPAGTIINTDSRKSEKTHYYYIMGLIIGIILCLVLVMAAVMMALRRRRIRMRKGLAKSSFDPVLGGLLTMFRYREIEAVTKNFAEILGSGGFGSVFKGTLPNASIIAVKKLNWLRQGEKQFRNEVSTIGTIQHVNLIRLLGFTCEGQHRLLAYEYMSNGSLDAWLFGKRTSIDWASRYRIALGTARGIAYLHEDCLHRIIHCDIKPENILLDHQFNAKVSDFGLAKILGKEFSRVMTTFRGTRGYLAPEWIAGMPLTTKVDMYSYGMTLLEMISGRRNMVQKDSQVSGEDCKSLEVVFFPIWAAKQMSKGNLLSLVDKRILENVNEEELRKLAYVAGWCIQDDENLRPTMKNVVAILEGTIDVDGPPPIPKSLQLLTLNDDDDEEDV